MVKVALSSVKIESRKIVLIIIMVDKNLAISDSGLFQSVRKHPNDINFGVIYYPCSCESNGPFLVKKIVEYWVYPEIVLFMFLAVKVGQNNFAMYKFLQNFILS